jgi:hypothetical protein
MQFVELYGTELDRELGSADRNQRFTTARRKAAINAAQLQFVKDTECLVKETTVTLVDDTQEYDLESTITDFERIAKQGVSIKIVSGSNTRYIEGDDLMVTTVERLNVEEPGWRSVSKGTPTSVYVQRNGGALNLGFHPKPSISGDTWTAIVPYVLIPADMSADADEPFTVSSNILKSMRPWHRALVHYAAYDMEKFRKDTARGAAQLQLYQVEVSKYTGVQKPHGGQSVRFARIYRQSGMTNARFNPRA